MSDPIYKTIEEEIKLRAAGESAEPVAPSPQRPANSSTGARSPDSETVQNPIPLETPQPQNFLKPQHLLPDPDELLDVIIDPNAPEQEWILACDQLERHNRRQERKRHSKANKSLRHNMKALIIGVFGGFVVLGGALFATNFSHRELQSSPQVGTQSKKHSVPLAATADIDYGPYMATLQREIRQNWSPPRGRESIRIRTQFKISKDGRINDVRIPNPSGLPEEEIAALKAIIAKPRVHPLPAGSPESVDVQFTFDENVFRESGTPRPAGNRPHRPDSSATRG